MKKRFTTLCCVVLLLSLVSIGYCKDDPYADCYTDYFLNGRFIMKGVENGKRLADYDLVATYFSGLYDGVLFASSETGSKELIQLYGEHTKKWEIFDAICIYYQSNPAKRSRPIASVFLSGAK